MPRKQKGLYDTMSTTGLRQAVERLVQELLMTYHWEEDGQRKVWKSSGAKGDPSADWFKASLRSCIKPLWRLMICVNVYTYTHIYIYIHAGTSAYAYGHIYI